MPVIEDGIFELKQITLGIHMLLSEADKDFLHKCALGRLCTIDQQGYPHCVRLDYLCHEGHIYVGTRGKKKWLVNISVHPKVAFEVDVYERIEGEVDWRGLMIKGKAVVVEDQARRKDALKLLRRRHPDAPFGEDTTIVSIAPRSTYRWGPWAKFAKQ